MIRDATMLMWCHCNKMMHNGLCFKPQVPTQRVGTSLTHWGQVTHICVSELTTISSDNGLRSGQCKAIIWTNAGTNFSEILIAIQGFHWRKYIVKCRQGNVGHFISPQCVKYNVIYQVIDGGRIFDGNMPNRIVITLTTVAPFINMV